MPTYEYDCPSCGRFEIEQRMSDPALDACPKCQSPVRRVIGTGAGFIIRGGGAAGHAGSGTGGGCSLERTGRTCCGRDQRCDKPPCDGHDG